MFVINEIVKNQPRFIIKILSAKNYFNRLWLAVLFIAFAFVRFSFAQNTPCRLDEKTLQFAGSPVEQARCLLRPNKIYGALGAELKKLPDPLEKIIGAKTVVEKAKLRRYLENSGIAEEAVGGSIDAPLSIAELLGGEKIQAVYFVIHDTSSPYLKNEPFPPDFDTNADWRGNNLEIWLKLPVAHIFINRLGASITTTPFDETVRKGWGTKFARDILKTNAKGLELHIELVQPRRRETDGTATNDAIAPVPGFTDAQYARLALIYICAGARRGTWLVPAYHAAIDAGIPDAHDDPQNFDLKKFAVNVKRLLKKMKNEK